MHRRMIPAALFLGASLLVGVSNPAGAVTLPTDLMRPIPAEAARGLVYSWTFSILIESTDLTAIEPCRKILAGGGYLTTLSKTANTASPDLHFKIAGSKEYPQANVAADEMLAAVQQAKCAGTLTWSVTSKPAVVGH